MFFSGAFTCIENAIEQYDQNVYNLSKRVHYLLCLHAISTRRLISFQMLDSSRNLLFGNGTVDRIPTKWKCLVSNNRLTTSRLCAEDTLKIIEALSFTYFMLLLGHPVQRSNLPPELFRVI